MSTTTTRLGLVKPATTEDYDVGIVNTNADKIDAAVGITPATSTTRPSTDLFDGRAVHESDTGELVIRRASVWSLLGTLAATADRLARRGAGGRLKVGTAVDPDDAVTKAQLDAATTPLPDAGITAYRNAALQNIAGGIGTVTVILDAAEAGSAGLTLNTSTGEVTVSAGNGGIFEVSAIAAVREPTAGDSRLFASIYVNGIEKIRGTDTHRRTGKAADQTSSAVPARRITLAAGDVVALRVFHDGASAAELLPGGSAGSAVTWIQLRRVA